MQEKNVWALDADRIDSTSNLIFNKLCQLVRERMLIFFILYLRFRSFDSLIVCTSYTTFKALNRLPETTSFLCNGFGVLLYTFFLERWINVSQRKTFVGGYIGKRKIYRNKGTRAMSAILQRNIQYVRQYSIIYLQELTKLIFHSNLCCNIQSEGFHYNVSQH